LTVGARSLRLGTHSEGRAPTYSLGLDCVWSERHGATPTFHRMRASLAAVSRAIVACEQCPRLRSHCRRLARVKKHAYQDWIYWGKPVPGFGDPAARLLVVGLAPAAHGANRTGRLFTGDASGSWLYEALYRYGFANQPQALARDDGLVLRDCYISAAARCAPPANKPSRAELEHCRAYLAAELRLLGHLRVVVTLGRIAHESWLKAAGWWSTLTPRERPRFAHGATALLPSGLVVIASYHPSRQNTNTGKLTRGMWNGVFRDARAILDRATPSPGRLNNTVARTSQPPEISDTSRSSRDIWRV
jgi:uracil-DNA glycosylase